MVCLCRMLDRSHAVLAGPGPTQFYARLISVRPSYSPIRPSLARANNVNARRDTSRPQRHSKVPLVRFQPVIQQESNLYFLPGFVDKRRDNWGQSTISPISRFPGERTQSASNIRAGKREIGEIADCPQLSRVMRRADASRTSRPQPPPMDLPRQPAGRPQRGNPTVSIRPGPQLRRPASRPDKAGSDRTYCGRD